MIEAEGVVMVSARRQRQVHSQLEGLGFRMKGFRV